MKISASVTSRSDAHLVEVSTEGVARPLAIAGKAEGPGSSVNGGELLFLALATCYCNDVFREATRAGIVIDEVVVTVNGEFDGPGDPARDVSFDVCVRSGEPEETVRELLQHTDRVAEIQNTLRQGVEVDLRGIEVSAGPAGPAGPQSDVGDS